ncbi:MAG TPA: alpha-ribazole phosphatase [Bacillota bacterium]|nr:alpha-ribazole phosphatase [Bacillota bacterium]
MGRMFLVRHGETIWNNELRYQGHSDIPLNEAGRQQASKLADRLKGEKIDYFYASDLSRAMETAQIIAEPHAKTVTGVELLRETRFGVWEGMKFTEIQEMYPELWEKWKVDPRGTLIPEGEYLDHVAARVMQGIREIMTRHPHDTVLVAAHGGTIRLILAELLQMDLSNIWRIRQDNTALNIIDIYGDRPIVAVINDIHHLGLGLPK